MDLKQIVAGKFMTSVTPEGRVYRRFYIFMRVAEERDNLQKLLRLSQGCKVSSAFVIEHQPVFLVWAMRRCLRIHPGAL
jgi:hypothetical protein